MFRNYTRTAWSSCLKESIKNRSLWLYENGLDPLQKIYKFFIYYKNEI
jgi:hypothetical protein